MQSRHQGSSSHRMRCIAPQQLSVSSRGGSVHTDVHGRLFFTDLPAGWHSPPRRVVRSRRSPLRSGNGSGALAEHTGGDEGTGASGASRAGVGEVDAEGTIGTEPGPWRVALSPASNAVLVAGVDTVSVHELADPRAANVDDHLPEGTLAEAPVSISVPDWGSAVAHRDGHAVLTCKVTVTVVPVAEASVDSYKLTWGRSFLRELNPSATGTLPVRLQPQQHSMQYVLPADTVVPPAATHLLAFACRGDEVSIKPASIRIDCRPLVSRSTIRIGAPFYGTIGSSPLALTLPSLPPSTSARWCRVGLRGRALACDVDVGILPHPNAMEDGVVRYEARWGSFGLLPVPGVPAVGHVDATATTLRLPAGAVIPERSDCLLVLAVDASGRCHRRAARLSFSELLDGDTGNAVPPLDTARCTVLHAAFHPMNHDFVVVLSSDYRVRMFDVQRGGNDPLVTVALDFDSVVAHGHPVTFCFGAACDFERFCVFVGMSSGAVFMISPLVPDRCSIPRSEWVHMRAAVEADIHAHSAASSAHKRSDASNAELPHLRRLLRWLDVAWQDPNHRNASTASGGARSPAAWMSCRPEWRQHMWGDAEAAEFVPAMQGPLPVHPEPPAREDDSGEALASLVCLPAALTPVTVLVKLYRSGRLEMVGCLEPFRPLWSATPEPVVGRSSVATVAGVPGGVSWTLLECLDLEFAPETPNRPPQLGDPPFAPSLIAASHDLYCVHSRGVTVVHAPWLSQLSTVLQSLTSRGSVQPHLPTVAEGADDAEEHKGTEGPAPLSPSVVTPILVPDSTGMVIGAQVFTNEDQDKFVMVLQEDAHEHVTTSVFPLNTNGMFLDDHGTVLHGRSRTGDSESFAQKVATVAPFVMSPRPLQLSLPGQDQDAALHHDYVANVFVRPAVAVHDMSTEMVSQLEDRVDKLARSTAVHNMRVAELREGLKGSLEKAVALRAKQGEIRARLQALRESLHAGSNRLSRREKDFIREIHALSSTCASLDKLVDRAAGIVEQRLASHPRMHTPDQSLHSAIKAHPLFSRGRVHDMLTRHTAILDLCKRDIEAAKAVWKDAADDDVADALGRLCVG